MIIRLSERAESDLSDIRNYTLTRFGADQTDHYLSGIEDAFVTLLAHPALGKPADHIRVGYRMIGAGSHIIYYRLSRDFIDIIAILHQRMNPFLHLDF